MKHSKTRYLGEIFLFFNNKIDLLQMTTNGASKYMTNNYYKYIWRCARCSYHFATITKTDGIIKQEKKCPKCKSLNTLTLSDKNIFINCKLFDSHIDNYNLDIEESRYPFPEETSG